MASQSDPIDRRGVVGRHGVVVRGFDGGSAVSVGNGGFAFTVDATGLQTFPGVLCTMSEWGMHRSPNPGKYEIDKFAGKLFDVGGRKVWYADADLERQTEEVRYLRENPHRMHLGSVGFVITHADGKRAQAGELKEMEQKLELWNGWIDSEFVFEGKCVRVRTICHPRKDLVAVRVESVLLVEGKLGVELKFGYPSNGISGVDWSRPEAHGTEMVQGGADGARLVRKVDEDGYEVGVKWSGGGMLKQLDAHVFMLTTSERVMEFVVAFAPVRLSGELPGFGETERAVSEHWEKFWSTGGAVDLSGSGDLRWRELERRVVLSAYLTAIQCAGSLPPAETGLTCNSWFGKFHLEMHWWHAAHFAIWNRIELLERSLGWYETILDKARGTARRQGYEGARWPKMTCGSGDESPSPIGPFLVWQQGHPIYFAELCWRSRKSREVLERYRDVVFESAEFMASYAWEGSLGPVLQCAQEIFDKERTLNPTFELTYWRWGLETSQRWRERLGLQREVRWDDVLRRLARPGVVEGKYAFAESVPECYAEGKWRNDHPSVLGAMGMLAGPGIEGETMRRTLRWVWEKWNWESTWGWDYPMIAMCAARLGERKMAVDALLMDAAKNRWLVNGHNYQREGLGVYLPGNGGLLMAVGMMAMGWEGGVGGDAPGFPEDGSWRVRYENLREML